MVDDMIELAEATFSVDGEIGMMHEKSMHTSLQSKTLSKTTGQINSLEKAGVCSSVPRTITVTLYFSSRFQL